DQRPENERQHAVHRGGGRGDAVLRVETFAEGIERAGADVAVNDAEGGERQRGEPASLRLVRAPPPPPDWRDGRGDRVVPYIWRRAAWQCRHCLIVCQPCASGAVLAHRPRRGGTLMATAKQRAAARKNVKKAASAARRKRTIVGLPKRTRPALGKEG